MVDEVEAEFRRMFHVDVENLGCGTAANLYQANADDLHLRIIANSGHAWYVIGTVDPKQSAIERLRLRTP